MDEIYSISGGIALWLVLSVSLWWLRRCWVHNGQNQRIERVERAALLLAEAQPVFGAIRLSSSLKLEGAETLRTETYALLKRIQESGEFFDKVAQLRAQLNRLTPPIECPPLAEILHIRRDLWAASEIVLADDLQRFGEAFSSEATFERFRAEAVALLFKRSKTGDDLIDVRLALAGEEADQSLRDMKAEVSAIRERDRLPTFAEAIAYPIAAIRAIPGRLRASKAFAVHSYRTIMAGANAIRQSEVMARGVEGLRQARQGLPQRVATGLDRASALTRDSRKQLGKHYEFLLAAYDYQAKYEQLLRKAPELSERGKQFITRLELAERSERLRLSSANLLVWLWRGFLHSLSYSIATLQRLHIAYLEARAQRALKPQPLRHLQTSAFAMAAPVGMAVSSVTVKPAGPIAPAIAAATAPAEAKRSRKKSKTAQAQLAPQMPVPPSASEKPRKTKTSGKKDRSAARKSQIEALAVVDVAPALPATEAASSDSVLRDNSTPGKTEKKEPKDGIAPASQTASPAVAAPAKAKALEKTIDAEAPKRAATIPQPKSDPKPAPARTQNGISANGKKPAAAPSVLAAQKKAQPAAAAIHHPKPNAHANGIAEPESKAKADQQQAPAAKQPIPKPSKAVNPAISAALEPMPPLIAASPSLEEPGRKRASIFGRLFAPLRRRVSNDTETDEAALSIADLVSQVVNEANLKAEGEKFSPLLAVERVKTDEALRQPAPTLLAKLSGIMEAEDATARSEAADARAEDADLEDDADDDSASDEPTEERLADEDDGDMGDEDDDDMGPLTRSVMEAQAKYATEAPQIRSFPWLRRWDNECL